MNTRKAFTVTKQQGRGIVSSYLDLLLAWGKAGRMATENHPFVVSARVKFYREMGALVAERFGNEAMVYILIDWSKYRVWLYFDPMKAALSGKQKRISTLFQVQTFDYLNPTAGVKARSIEYASILNNPTSYPFGGLTFKRQGAVK